MEAFTSLTQAQQSRITKVWQRVMAEQHSSIAELLWQFLTCGQIRRRNYLLGSEQQLLREVFIQYAEQRIAKGEPIGLYFYDLPLKTARDTTAADAAEALMFHNLEFIARQVQQVYEPGLKFTVVSDGSLFSLGSVVSELKVQRYRQNCELLIEKMQLSAVRLVDWLDDAPHLRRTFEAEVSALTPAAHLPVAVMDKFAKRVSHFLPEASPQQVERALRARAFFQKYRPSGVVHPAWGFKLTQHAHRSSAPSLCIYPLSPQVEISPSRGMCLIDVPSSRVRIVPEGQLRAMLQNEAAEPQYANDFGYHTTPFYYLLKETT